MKRTFRNKKVTVVGIARSGIAAALLLKNLGAMVYATDSGDSEDLREHRDLLEANGVKVELGKHSRDFVRDKDMVVISPGVPDDLPILKWARTNKIPVIGEIELGYRCCTAPIVAVTGTNGKSTTATLIGEILRRAGKDAVVCGNIGSSFCGELPKVKNDSVVVLEVSSFQLLTINDFRPHVAVILNISQNHFDRHLDFDSYLNAKVRIFINQKRTDWAVLNYDDAIVRDLREKTKAGVVYFSRSENMGSVYYENGSLYILVNGKGRAICKASELKIKGKHNIENALASLCVASILGVSPERSREALIEFKGLEHRFEHFATIDGIEYINDSKGTTVFAAMRALESCTKPVILIAGGRDKGSDFSKIREAVIEKVKKMILIGEAKDKIKTQLKGTVPMFEAASMEEAVKKAYFHAEEGDCILLSPMCASFDMFRDFEERGKIFKEAVSKLKTATR